MWLPQFLLVLFRGDCGAEKARHKVWRELCGGGKLRPQTKQAHNSL